MPAVTFKVTGTLYSLLHQLSGLPIYLWSISFLVVHVTLRKWCPSWRVIYVTEMSPRGNIVDRGLSGPRSTMFLRGGISVDHPTWRAPFSISYRKPAGRVSN
jgi:hypothetical protein